MIATASHGAQFGMRPMSWITITKTVANFKKVANSKIYSKQIAKTYWIYLAYEKTNKQKEEENKIQTTMSK